MHWKFWQHVQEFIRDDPLEEEKPRIYAQPVDPDLIAAKKRLDEQRVRVVQLEADIRRRSRT